MKMLVLILLTIVIALLTTVITVNALDIPYGMGAVGVFSLSEIVLAMLLAAYAIKD